MSRYAMFYATKQDSLDLLLYLEERAPLVYVRWGHYDSPRAPTYVTAADVPDLGTAEHGRKGDNRYLVLPTRATLKYYKHRGPGGPEYEPQPRGNSPYVFFHSGGIFRGECLIAGEVWTAFENREAVRFFDCFYRALRTRFTRVGDGPRGGSAGATHLGPQALGLLQAGMRLTASATSPRGLDFKLPRGWQPPGPGTAPDRGRRQAEVAVRPRGAGRAGKPPRHDKVLLTGSDEELNEYIETSGKCLVVDWRSDEGDLTDALAELLPAGRLSGEWDDDGDGDLYVTYRGVRHKVGLRMEPADRYRWLRRMNEIMAGDYELRGFRHTLGDDTHCFLPARCAWWAAMDAASPEKVRRVFARITRRSRFP